jgi:hypothetical protein
MMNEGKQFEPSSRVIRVDCYLDKATQSVLDFSHSDEGSRTDTNSYRVYEIRNPEKRKEVLRKCEQRVWNEVTWKNRYEAFLKSLVYAKFLANEKKTICYKTFRNKACMCVKTPCPSSCIDLLISGLGHYMKALKDAIVSRPTIANRLESCACERHTAHRQILTLDCGEEWISDEEEDSNLGDDEELPLMWEQLLNGRPIDFIKSSCCPEIEYPDFCAEVGSKTPKMLNWKCHTTDQNDKPICSECGSEKRFRTSECCSS